MFNVQDIVALKKINKQLLKAHNTTQVVYIFSINLCGYENTYNYQRK